MSFEIKASEGLVEVIVDDFREFVATYSARVSRDGVFIETPEKLKRGQLTVVQLRLADGFVLIKAQAMVAWNRDSNDALGRPEGVGLHFLEIDPDSTDLLDRIVSEHEEQGGLAFSVDREAPGADRQQTASTERLHSIVADREGGESSLEGIEGRAKGAIDVMPDPDDAGFAPGMERGEHDETLPEMGDKLDSMLAGANEEAPPPDSEPEEVEALPQPEPDRELNIDDLDSAFDDMIQTSGAMGDSGGDSEESPISGEEDDEEASFATVMIKDIDFDALKPPETDSEPEVTEVSEEPSEESSEPASEEASVESPAESSGESEADQTPAEQAPEEPSADDQQAEPTDDEEPVDPLPEGDGIEHLSEPVIPIDVSGQLEMDKRLLDDGYLEEPGFWRSSSGVLVLIVAGIALVVVVFLVISNLSATDGESGTDSPASQSEPADAEQTSDDAEGAVDEDGEGEAGGSDGSDGSESGSQ